MRLVIRFLAVLSIAALLAASAPWTSLRTASGQCCCPAGTCHCPGHQHDSRSTHSCCKGGLCGLNPPDSYLATLLSTLIYMPTEHRWAGPIVPWSFGHEASGLSLLSSHERIPDQPPRTKL